jgi:hypothetical protein
MMRSSAGTRVNSTASGMPIVTKTHTVELIRNAGESRRFYWPATGR